MTATLERMSDEQLMQLPEDGLKHEYVDGEVTDVPTGGPHGDIAATIIALLIGGGLKRFGRVLDSGVGCRMRSGNLRCPDVSFILKENLPDGRVPDGFLERAPDLCVEVISPSEDRQDALRKVEEYLDSGAQEVWRVFMESRRVVVYRSLDNVHTYAGDQELASLELLPGFACKVTDIFE